VSQCPAEASIISRLIKRTDDIDISYTGRVGSKFFGNPTLNLGPISAVNLQASDIFFTLK